MDIETQNIYFHVCANQRRRANEINKIMVEDGTICESQEDIGHAFINYYHKLFTSEARGALDDYLFS